VTAHRRARRLIFCRRAVQTVVLVLFFVLVAANRPQTGERPDGPVSLFFDLDPLATGSAWLAGRSLSGLAVLGLVTLAVTLVLGRVFCGWFCPFGTLHNAVGSLRRHVRRLRPDLDRFSRWQRAKYLLAIALLVMAAGGAQWIGVLDPFSVLYRSTALTVVPATHLAVSSAANAVYLGDPHLGSWHLREVTDPVYRWAQDHVLGPEVRLFTGTDLVVLIFAAALLLNLARNRFWCRYVCPLGGLLGLFARRPLLRLTGRPGTCNNCGACTLRCPAAARPEQPESWLATECFGCWNCVAACRSEGLDFRFAPPWRRTSRGRVDLRRRRILTGTVAGVTGLAMLRITPAAQGRTFNPALIRPPGARDEREFLARCVKCGICMQACPTGGLQPTLSEAGLEGVWTPILVPTIGYCAWECHACGQVCPTEAIAPLALAEKKKVKIGLAVIDTTRCLPYAYGRECIVCEEHCPIPDKAITFEVRDVRLRDGTTRALKHPRVDADRCTGCGICETKCPFHDLPAIRVTSAGETRHPRNQPILPGAEAVGPYG
jgi:MauM/NapG family ferredoxin protein